MSFLAFVRYSISSVLRNGRRSLFAIIGIVLALSLITGSFIAVDSSALGMLRSAIEDRPLDFEAYDYTLFENLTEESFASQIEAIESVKDVEAASPVVSLGGWDFNNGSLDYDMYIDGYETVLFLPSDIDVLLEKYKISGALPDPGTVAIAEQTADELDLSVGEKVTCTHISDSSYFDNGTWVYSRTFLNLSFDVSQIWSQEGSFEGDSRAAEGEDSDLDVWLNGILNPVFMNLADYGGVSEALLSADIGFSAGVSYLIWIDRDSVISIGDVPGTLERIEYIQGRLQIAGDEFGFFVSERGVAGPLAELYPQLEYTKLLFLVLCLPVVALGVYLSVVGVDLGVTERRREAGMLKSRGASNEQVFSSLMLESLTLGAFAGLAGLATGLLVSRALLGTAMSVLYEGESEISMADYGMTASTIFLSILFGVLLTFVSSYRSFKRVSRINVAETLHHYSQVTAKIEYRPRMDVIFLSISALSILGVLMGPDWAFDQEWSWMTELVVTVVILAGIAAFPAMPFLLSLGVIRLLTRTSRKLYARFTWIVKPWTKELHHLVDRNIVRNPRRASNLCVIISLALAFGLFVSVTMDSQIAYEEERVAFEVGSDIRVDVRTWDRDGGSYDSSGLDALANVDGVESFCVFEEVGIAISTSGYDWEQWSALVDPSSYAETVRPGDFYFIDGGRGLLEELDANGTVLMSERLARETHFDVGDSVQCKLQMHFFVNESYVWHESKFRLLVVGLVRGLHGFPNTNLFLSRETLGFLSSENLSGANGFGMGAFIDVSKGADPTAVAENASAVCSSAGFGTSETILADELEKLRTENQLFRALTGFLYMEYVMSVVIMTVGVGLLIFVAVTDREQEIACIMARGASGSQMRKILLGESVTLMVIGLLVGVSVGLLTAFLFNSLSAEQDYAEVEMRTVITLASWSVVLASVGAILLASLLATSRAGKMKLAEVLRVRGG